jgi:hypothetical protein
MPDQSLALPPLQLTPQQLAAIEASRASGSFALEAVAGSGKSFTLQQIASAIRGTGLATSFSKSTTEELVKRMPAGKFLAKSMHAVGLAAIRDSGKFNNQVTPTKVRDIVTELVKADGEAEFGIISPITQLVSLAKTYGITPTESALLPDEPASWQWLADTYDIDPFNPFVLSLAREALAKSTKLALEEGVLDFDDMLYISLLYPHRFPRYPSVIVDEAQDLNALQHQMVARILRPDGRVIAAGDQHQCHPPGTLVRVTGVGYVPIELLQPGDQLASFNQRKSYSPGRVEQGRQIENIQKSDFSGNLITITAAESTLRMTPNHKVLTKFGNLRGYALYVMQRGDQCRMGTCKLVYEPPSSHPQSGLGTRAGQENADKAWILQVYETDSEAKMWEDVYSAEFGIPQLLWTNPNNDPNLQAQLNLCWQVIGKNLHRLLPALEAFARDIANPLWTRDAHRHQGLRKSFLTTAANLLSGMQIAFDVENPVWIPVTVTKEAYTGPVYGLQVQPNEHGLRLYWANDFCVHNSIFAFRGALSNSYTQLMSHFSMSRMPLTVSFRCPKAVVSEAKKYVPEIESAPNAPEGEVIHHGSLSVYDVPKFVLCRNNAPLINLALKLLVAGRSAEVAGREIGQGLISLTKRITKKNLKRDEFVSRLTQWSEREKERRPQARGAIADKVSALRALAEAHKDLAEIQQHLLKLYPNPKDKNYRPAEVKLSTIHKAKGLEFPEVLFLDPHLLPSKYAEQEWEKVQEKNLFYVGITRAQNVLHYATSESIE